MSKLSRKVSMQWFTEDMVHDDARGRRETFTRARIDIGGVRAEDVEHFGMLLRSAIEKWNDEIDEAARKKKAAKKPRRKTV